MTCRHECGSSPEGIYFCINPKYPEYHDFDFSPCNDDEECYEE